jgi:hypothetical protein
MPDMDDLKSWPTTTTSRSTRGLEKAGDAAEQKIGHGDQIDKAVDKAQDATGNDHK